MEEQQNFGNAAPAEQIENQTGNYQFGGYGYQYQNEKIQPPPQETSAPTDESNDDKYAKQKHAVDFLQKVRVHYLKSPNVYNTFLEIMKDFKSAAIDTPEVITRVKELFRGNKMLLQEFNSFLPPGFKIEVTDSPELANQTTTEVDALEQNGQGNADNASRANPPPNDLEHARNYVRKIKNRFIHQPNIYKQFLEILHSYYQGQHAINEVLKEVADLFKTHTDLLEEFRQFLPKSVHTQEAASVVASSVQSQALHEVTSKKQKRKTVKSRDRDYDDKEEIYTTTSTRTRSAAAQEEREREKELARESGPLTRRRFGSSSQSQAAAPKESNHPPQVVYGYGYGYAYGMPYLDREAREREREMDERKRRRVDDNNSTSNSPTKEKRMEVAQEMTIFDELRSHLGSKLLLFDLLKCMVLYYQEVVSRNDLHTLAKKMLGSQGKLYDKFKRFLAWDEGDDREDETEIKPVAEPMVVEPTSEPPKTEEESNNNHDAEANTETKPAETAETTEEVSLQPIKTEPNGTAPEAAPAPAAEPETQYEEDFDETELTLLLVELLLEMNNACVRAIEGFYAALQESKGRLVPERLDACHIRVLERLYNDKARDIVVALETMPKAAVPVVVRRLKVRNADYYQLISELKEEKAKEKEKEKEREKEVVVNA